jgi:hypothetical protein
MVVTDSGTVTCAARRCTCRSIYRRGASRAAGTLRPIQGLRFWGSGVSLRLHEGPQVYRLWPIGPEGEPVELLAGVAAIVDTSIAVLKDSLVYPRRRGVTGPMCIGDCDKRLIVTVIESVDSLRGLLPEQGLSRRFSWCRRVCHVAVFHGLHEINSSPTRHISRRCAWVCSARTALVSGARSNYVRHHRHQRGDENLTPTTRRSTLTGTLRISRRPQPGCATDRPHGGALRRKPASTAADSVCPWILR